MASIRRVEQEQRLDELAAGMADVDIVLMEGYWRGNASKIEVSRRERSGTLLCQADELVALTSDQSFDLDVPQYELDNLGIVDLIEPRFPGD